MSAKSESYRKGKLDAIDGKPERPPDKKKHVYSDNRKEAMDKKVKDHYDYKEGHREGKKQK